MCDDDEDGEDEDDDDGDDDDGGEDFMIYSLASSLAVRAMFGSSAEKRRHLG